MIEISRRGLDADLEFSQGHWDSAETYPGVAIFGFPHKNLLTRGIESELESYFISRTDRTRNQELCPGKAEEERKN